MSQAPDRHRNSRPRIALSYARTAPGHPPRFAAELARLAARAAAGVEAAGGDAVVIDSSSGTVFRAGDFDGVLILGGGDVDPARYGGNSAEPTIHGVDSQADETEIDLVLGAYGQGRPVFGICRGLQLINVAFGGSLVEDLGRESVHRVHQEDAPMALHKVCVEPGSMLAGALGTGPVAVQSGHHQAVRRLGDRLQVSATADDGVVEAVELARPEEGWLVAVQWHREDEGSPDGQLAALLEPFVTACREALVR
ncbi:gamma-glutamyl-gamma-aminobutyrate hydrolase family protein [Arthrobacter deserti]|uniref:Gamma-glutamyl-gamma-aminobutyrate hydrolase family protein n=1 Tax=Arthrobacter deserti TaxID=1742687 RepID=A0ABX1JKX2_9MICC|nr:gamma-glutamyl-gamma-aminobutyrate hydrolase family protein [Arthrobacter deserti]